MLRLGLVRPRAARPSGGTQWLGTLVRLWRVTSGGQVDRRACSCCPEPEQRARTSGRLRDPVRRGVRGLRVAAACAGLVVLAGCGASGGDKSSAQPAASATPSGSISGAQGSSGSATAGADTATASVPHPACALSAQRVAVITGLRYLSVATEGPGSSGRGQCTYSSPRDGTKSLSVTYTALDSAATARRHFLAEVAADSDLPLVDLPGVGDRAWLYKRLEGPSHANNQQQMTILKANPIIQVATDDSPRKLPAKFDTKMTALGRTIAATAT